jgi:hypothetical protein
MKAINSIISLVFIFSFGNFKAQELTRSIYFNTASSELNFQSKQILQKLSLDLQSKEILEIKITGHTDDVGSESYNLDLSEKRVGQTISFLNEVNFPIDKLNKAALGENRPILSNKTNLGRKQNRRVEISIVYQEKATRKDNIKDLFKQIATKPNEFCVNPARDTVLVGRDGGIIEIKANSFELPVNCKEKCVLILLRENFTKSSMLLDNLTTLSDGKLLESDGMVDVAAFDCQGKPLSLVRGNEMTILVPTKNKFADIQFFDGQHNPSDSSLNWVLLNNRFDNLSGIKNPREFGPCIEDYQNKCGFCGLFCRIGRLNLGLKALKNKEQRAENKKFRECQKKEYRKRYGRKARKNRWKGNSGCEDLKKLFDKYKVDNIAALNDTLKKIKLKEIENALKDGTAGISDLNYYAFSKTNLGLANCDRFSKYDKSLLTTMYFDIKKDENLDVRVAFTEENIVVPAYQGANGMELKNVPRGKKVWVIALKVVKGAFFMSIFEVIVGEKILDFDFKKVSVKEIQDAFKRFDK